MGLRGPHSMAALIRRTQSALKPGPRHRYHCRKCGVLFHPTRTGAKFCSNRCRQRRYREKAEAVELESV